MIRWTEDGTLREPGREVGKGGRDTVQQGVMEEIGKTGRRDR